MKLTSTIEKEQQLLDLKIRFFNLVNGLLGGIFLVGSAIAVYKIVGIFL